MKTITVDLRLTYEVDGIRVNGLLSIDDVLREIVDRLPRSNLYNVSIGYKHALYLKEVDVLKGKDPDDN